MFSLMKSNIIRIKRPFTVCVMTLLFSYLLLMLGADIALTVIHIAVSALFLYFTLRKTVFSKILLLITLFITSASVSFSVTEAVREKENNLSGYGKEVHGTVTDIKFKEDGSIQSAVLSDCFIDNTKVYSKITLYPGNNTSFSYGDRLCFTASEIKETSGDGIYRFHGLSDRSFLSCYNKSDEYSVTEAESNLYISILKLRSYSSEKLRSALSTDSFSVAQALFTGSKDAVSPSLTYAFRICGISHIFAVSGMHLSLWTGLFFLIFKRKAKNSFLPNILAALFVVFYIVFTGFSPSVLRAGIMLITVFCGRIIKRASDPLNSLGLSGTILLILNPYLAGNVSFLLSFTATGAIALWSEFILPEKSVTVGKLRRIRIKLKQLFYDIIISAAVILTTLPIVSLFFGYFSLMAPVASLIITPLAQAVMIVSAFLVILPEGNFIFSVFQFFTNSICEHMIKTVTALSEADFLLIPAEFSLLLPCFLITIILCGIFIIFYKDRSKTLISILSGTLIFCLLTAVNLYIHKDESEIVIFGRENATLIAVTSNLSDSAIIGSGGSYSLVSELSGYLQRRTIAKADLLFIPRNTDTENRNTEYIGRYLSPENTVSLYNTSSSVSSALWNNNSVTGFTDESFSAICLYIDDIKIVICTLPSSVFGENREEFMSGDILICRSNIPATLDTSAFSDIIVITDRERIYPFPFISSKDSDIKITVKGDSYAIH